MTDHPTDSFVDEGADLTELSDPAAPEATTPPTPPNPSDPTEPYDPTVPVDPSNPVEPVTPTIPDPSSPTPIPIDPPTPSPPMPSPPTPPSPPDPVSEGVAADGAVVEGPVEDREDVGEVGQTEIPVESEEVVDDETMRRAIEAILMVSDEPLPALTLARAVGRATGDVSETLEALSAEYTEQGRGFDLREVAGGWRYYTREDAATYVERFVLDGQQARLTQAALETLAVVAYKQPVSRARVSAIRGVNVDGVMRTLVTRGLVEEAGTDTESQATLYRTTSYFLERMGMQSLDNLPELAPYLPDMDDIEDELPPPSTPDTTETPHTSETPDTTETAEATDNEASDEREAVRAGHG